MADGLFVLVRRPGAFQGIPADSLLHLACRSPQELSGTGRTAEGGAGGRPADKMKGLRKP
jgi:hypothetical protein